ncbi:MAG: Uma2 family endonuclease [Desulfatirhabdiaceae bacterium]
MTATALTKATYDDLYTIPENRIGEIIDGELFATPRPSFRHSNVVSGITGEIIGPFRRGRDGPGGWIILYEPEICLGENILVPDLAGWKKERLSKPPEENYTTIVPDWICEVLSPGTVRIDRIRKMPIYAGFGVPHIWLIDPIAKTLEVYKLETGRWLLLSTDGDKDRVRAEPFQEIEIDLDYLWWD